ncbi:hypothetical protein J2X69_005105, partial [Algoriphagus sp. 4150]|nr:hypothetical protein [Algoriphagus sp. 4150]
MISVSLFPLVYRLEDRRRVTEVALTLPDFGCHILVFRTVKLSDCFTILFLGCSG